MWMIRAVQGIGVDFAGGFELKPGVLSDLLDVGFGDIAARAHALPISVGPGTVFLNAEDPTRLQRLENAAKYSCS